MSIKHGGFITADSRMFAFVLHSKHLNETIDSPTCLRFDIVPFFFLNTLGNNILNEWTNSKHRKILWSKARLMALSWNSQNWPDERLQFSSDLSFHCLLREGRKKSFARIQMWSMAKIHRMFIPLWCYTRGSSSLFSYPIFSILN